MRKTSFLFALGIVVAVVTAAYTGYAMYQRSSLDTEVARLNAAVLEYQDQLTQYEDNNVEAAIAAKKTVEVLGGDAIKWSEVIKDVRKTIPSDDGEDVVDIISYSGSGGKSISISVRTQGSSKNPYIDVAMLIQAFDDSELFADNFVPSISSGTDAEGNDVLTFMLTTTYVGSDGTVSR